MQVQAIILAAGKGTRMHSQRAKVLHQISGQAMLGWQLATLSNCEVVRAHIVVGHKADEVAAFVEDCDWANCVVQAEQLGTGHATRLGVEGLDPEIPVVVLAGDIPFVSANLLKRTVVEAVKGNLALVTTRLANPTGYGRVVRHSTAGEVVAIVEESDADEAVRAIDEVYCGIVAALPRKLADWLAQLSNNNAQGEYYLPEVVPAAIADGVSVVCVETANRLEVEGVNSQAQLVALERAYSLQQAQFLLAQGVYIADPARVDIRGRLVCGKDVRIDPNVVIQGNVTLADGVSVGTGCVLEDCQVGAYGRIEPYCHIVNTQVGKQCSVGPFARLRGGSTLLDGSSIGNFVEMKNSQLGRGSKAAHLSYMGDTHVGDKANIGAGTITCNYDGVNKHRTHLGDGVFIGSNSSLVAPLHIGDHALIGAGSIITKDVPDGGFAIGRARQLNRSSRSK